ncbi:MAG: TonB-dependent receptor [Rudaea sp.]|uniref:TonB-dependent receptor n=1 Tax=unclassified Rudaea TaxID=2627037 RepID=UPI0010F97781|nr:MULTISPECIES: TonB-dependent receptor [unclassified Rudaea]MBN8886596.1 TonB-dependent receptor [Rudaea sp.]
MNHSNTCRAALARAGILRRHPLALACATVLMSTTIHAADGAPALDPQTAPTQATANAAEKKTGTDADSTLGTITVTGIKASLQTAMKIKQNSDAIVEAISAEDIGKLPDVSIAESLARLPGVTTQRLDGHANLISIRGLAPDFVGTTLNGREQATVGENRGVEFDQYPSELISGAVVYKTPEASLIGQGLSGTVDLHTLRPLDFKDRKFAFNLRGEHNTNGDLNPGADVGNNGHRISASYIDQFFDHTVGLAIGFAQLDSPIQSKNYKAWWFAAPNGDYPGSLAHWGADPTKGVPDNVLVQQGMELRAKSESQLRNGIMGVLEWAPSDSYHGMLDIYYSKFKQEAHTNGLQWSSSAWDGIEFSNIKTGPGITPYLGNSLVTSGTMNGLAPIDQNEYNKERDYLFSVGWNNRFQFADQWSAMVDLSYSRATNKIQDAYLFSGVASGLTSAQFNILNGPGFPTFTLPVDLTNPANFRLVDAAGYSRGSSGGYTYDGREEFDKQKDTIKAFRAEVSHPLGWIFSSMDLGVNYSERRKDKQADVYYAYLMGNGCSTAYSSSAPDFNASCKNLPYVPTFAVPLGSGLARGITNLSFGGIPGILNYDVLGALASQYYILPVNGTNDLNRNYSVTEKVPVAYAKFNISTELAGIPIRGNVGVQFVHTDQSSSALQINDHAVVGTISGSTTYNNVLPSLNLAADLDEGQVLRFALAKEMARGRIDDEKIASSAYVAPVGSGPCPVAIKPGEPCNVWSGSGGNIFLKPYVAVGTDLSYEKYFGEISYFAVGVFNKNLLNYIYQSVDPNYDFSKYTNTSSLTPVSQFGTYTTSRNGTGGMMQGVEISAQLEGQLIHPVLDGFGIKAGFAYVKSKLPTTSFSKVSNAGGFDPPTTLPGLSTKSSDVGVFYEKNGWSFRLDQNYRSDYTGEITAAFGQLGYTKIRAHTQTDFQAGYEFTSGPANGLSLLLQVVNLTNAPSLVDLKVQNNPDNITMFEPQRYNVTGRTILFGLNYKL